MFSNELTIACNWFTRALFGITSSSFLLNGVVQKPVECYKFDGEFEQKVIDLFYIDSFSGLVDTLDDI